jgi:DNA polymerase-1
MRKHPLAQCESCALRNEPYVPSWGDVNAKYIIVGEAPGAQEAAQGRPFVGQSGKLLFHVLKEAGIAEDQVFVCNTVSCRPPGNRTPFPEEEQHCKGRLVAEIARCKATSILAVGKSARDVLGGEQSAWTVYRDKRVLSTWHPAYILRRPAEMGTLLSDCKRFARGLVQELPELRITYVEELPDIVKALFKIPDGEWVAVDLETNQLEWYDRAKTKARAILLVALAWSGGEIVIDADILYRSAEARKCLQDTLDRVSVCAHNGKFDAIFLQARLGIHMYTTFDTLLAHYTLDENSSHKLKDLAQSILEWPSYKDALKPYLKSEKDEYSKVPYEVLTKYAAYDVIATLSLQRIFMAELVKEDLLRLPFYGVLMPANEALIQVELHGMALDTDALDKWIDKFTEELTVIEDEAREMVDLPNLNLNSPKQLSDLLYVQLKLPRPNMYGVKPNSTSEGALESLKDHPFVEKLLHYRRVHKIVSSYLTGLKDYCGTDGRVHTSFVVQGAETGRISTRNPALQTIPRPDDYYGAAIRSLFTHAPGNKLVIVDYSQAELRVLAAMTHDPFLVKVYKEDRDLHAEVAEVLFGKGYTKQQRQLCKKFNFEYAYGGSGYSSAHAMGLPEAQIVPLMKKYSAMMEGVVKWKQEQMHKARTLGYVDTPTGRRRRFPIITPDNLDDVRKAAINMPVQGMASDLTLIAATELVREGLFIVLLVHDSIIAEVPEDEAQAVADRIMNKMVEVGDRYYPEIPWKADIDIVDTWAKSPDSQ